MKFLLFPLVALILLSACSSSAQDQNPIPQSIPADLLILLETTNCYGRCPKFRVTVDARGHVVFEGISNTKSDGRKEEYNIAEERVLELFKEIVSSGYFTLEDEYSQRKNCKDAATDFAWAKTSVRMNGKEKAVMHYRGCVDDARDIKILNSFEAKIEEVTDVGKYLPKY